MNGVFIVLRKFREMGSKALQSLWVQRLRPARDYHASKVGEVEPRWASEEEEDDIDMEEKSRFVLRPCLLPNLDLENRILPNINTNTQESADLVTETQVIASFGPFQVKSRSVIPPTRSETYAKKPSGMDTHRPALLPLPDDRWKQFSQGREKEESCEKRLQMGNIEQDRDGFTSGLLASYYKPIKNDYISKHPILDCHYNLSGQHKLSEFQWNEPQKQKPENNIWNRGVFKEVVPSTRNHIGSSNQKRDWSECKRPFESENLNRSIGFPHPVRPSICPDFRIVKQMQIPENWESNCYADQQATWKPASESLPNIKANPSDAKFSSREQLLETSSLQPLLGRYRYGIEQEPRGFDSMGKYPFHSDIFRGPNYPGLGKQKDKIMPPHYSGSTASLPNDVYGGFHDRVNDTKKLKMCGFYPGAGTTFIRSDVSNSRPIRERGYLEPDVHSFDHFNFPGLAENSSRAQKRDTRFSKQCDIAKDAWLNVKGKASNLEKAVREQMHEKEFAGGFTGYAFQYTSYDAINQAIQAVIPCLSSQAQPVSFHISAREEEVGQERDGSEKGNLKDGKISTTVQCVLSGKEYRRNNINFNAGNMSLDGHEFHQLKSRKQSAEEGPTFQRLRNLSNEREDELDCSKHVRLKISSADEKTSISGKRTCCTNKGVVQTDMPLVNNIETRSEANAIKSSSPEMWLQRWIHSTERTDLVSEQEVSENLNCNPLKAHGSLAGTSTQEWSGDNRQTDFIQWKNNRKHNYISFSNTRSQTWGDGHFKSNLKGSRFMKTFLTSSASAMAIMGNRVKEMYAAQSDRNGIFPVRASTQCADADAKATGPEKEMTIPDGLEPKPKKAFEQELIEHNVIKMVRFNH